MQIKNRKAYDAIISARTNLLVSNGFFGFLAMQLRLLEDDTMPTAAVDGVSLFYNPDFVNQLNDRQCEFLICHEVMHCCLKHFSRRQGRQIKPWNAACDFVINLDLKDSGFELIHDVSINGKNFRCCIDEKYRGMTSEEIYDSFPQVEIDFYVIGDGSGWDVGGVLDAPNGQTGEEQTKHTWDKAVRSAIAVMKASGIGSVPGILRHLMADLDRPKVSWKDLTWNFIDQSMSKEPSWARISRRSVAIGTLLPGVVSDRLNHLVFAVDSSGSVNDKMFREMLSEVAGALDQGTADQLTVIYADTHVHDVFHYVMGDIVKPKPLKGGGGGTAFSDTFKYISENIPDASCIIYLTDLEVFDFGEDPGIPTLWAVFTHESQFSHMADKVPFGLPILVSTSML